MLFWTLEQLLVISNPKWVIEIDFTLDSYSQPSSLYPCMLVAEQWKLKKKNMQAQSDATFSSKESKRRKQRDVVQDNFQT